MNLWRLLFEMLKREQEEEAARKQALTQAEESPFVCPLCKAGKQFEEVVFLEVRKLIVSVITPPSKAEL